MIVTLGPTIHAETVPEPDENGVRWKLVDLTRWYSSPPLRSDITDAPQSDTAFDADRSWRGQKSMVLEFMLTASSTAAAVAYGWQKVAGIAPRGERLTLTVTDPTGTYTQRVRVDGTPDVKPFTDRRARCFIPIVAPDGRKYGPYVPELEAQPAGLAGESGLIYPLFGPINTGTLNFGQFAPSGLIEIKNTGTAESWPIFRVQGQIASAGFQIVSQGAVLEYAGPVALGDEITLSPYSGGRASKAGVDVTGEYLTRSEWAPVGPGETRQFVFNPLGTFDTNARLFADFREAWW